MEIWRAKWDQTVWLSIFRMKETNINNAAHPWLFFSSFDILHARPRMRMLRVLTSQHPGQSPRMPVESWRCVGYHLCALGVPARFHLLIFYPWYASPGGWKFVHEGKMGLKRKLPSHCITARERMERGKGWRGGRNADRCANACRETR